MDTENQKVVTGAVVTGMVFAGLYYFLFLHTKVNNLPQQAEDPPPQDIENSQLQQNSEKRENSVQDTRETDTTEAPQNDQSKAQAVFEEEDTENPQKNQQKSDQKKKIVLNTQSDLQQQPLKGNLEFDQLEKILQDEWNALKTAESTKDSQKDGDNPTDGQQMVNMAPTLPGLKKSQSSVYTNQQGIFNAIAQQMGALQKSKSVELKSSMQLKKNKLVKIEILDNKANIFTLDTFERIHEETVYRCCEEYAEAQLDCRKKRRMIKGNKSAYATTIAMMFSHCQQLLQQTTFQICIERGFSYMDYQRSMSFYQMNGQIEKMKEVEKHYNELLHRSLSHSKKINRQKAKEMVTDINKYLQGECAQWLREISCRNIELVCTIIECLIQDHIQDTFDCEVEDLEHRLQLSRLNENDAIKKLNTQREELIQKLLIPFRQQQFMVIYSGAHQ